MVGRKQLGSGQCHPDVPRVPALQHFLLIESIMGDGRAQDVPGRLVLEAQVSTEVPASTSPLLWTTLPVLWDHDAHGLYVLWVPGPSAPHLCKVLTPGVRAMGIFASAIPPTQKNGC